MPKTIEDYKNTLIEAMRLSQEISFKNKEIDRLNREITNIENIVYSNFIERCIGFKPERNYYWETPRNSLSFKKHIIDPNTGKAHKHKSVTFTFNFYKDGMLTKTGYSWNAFDSDETGRNDIYLIMDYADVLIDRIDGRLKVKTNRYESQKDYLYKLRNGLEWLRSKRQGEFIVRDGSPTDPIRTRSGRIKKTFMPPMVVGTYSGKGRRVSLPYPKPESNKMKPRKQKRTTMFIPKVQTK